MLSTNECQSPSALAVTVASGHAPARLHCGSRNLRQALGYNFALLAFGNALLKQHFQIKERLFLIRGGGEQSLLGIRTRRAAMTSRLWRCCSVTWDKGSHGTKGQVLTVAVLVRRPRRSDEPPFVSWVGSSAAKGGRQICFQNAPRLPRLHAAAATTTPSPS